MREYEVVREIQNLCMNNQMRDIFFDEIETDDPESYVRTILKSDNPTLTVDWKSDGSCVIFASTDGLTQKFVFTPLWSTVYNPTKFLPAHSPADCAQGEMAFPPG